MSERPLPEVWQVENHRRSVLMLAPQAPALDREQAAEVLADLITALLEVRRLMRHDR